MRDQKAIDAAGRLAGFIGVVKWAMIAVYAAGMLLSIALATSGGSETTMNEDGTITLGTDNTVSTVFASGAVFGGVVAALGTWVLFGWFQHTLRMLALSAGLSLRANPPAYVQPPLQAAP